MNKPGDLFNLIIGANMAFRRSVLNDIGFFDPLFSLSAPIPAAEDIDMIYRVYKSGYSLEYVRCR